MSISWKWAHFDELSPFELYEILQARHRVFAIEQNCLFEDLDDLDQISQHLVGRRDGRLSAYLRLLPVQEALRCSSASRHPGAVSIGRVMTIQSCRKMALGRLLMIEGLRKYREKFAEYPLIIGAQMYLIDFYRSLGFEQEGQPYDEDGITHINMRWRPSTS
ncbi:MAG: GNAT family N-acetyltransferase [Myxococcales bacterium]|nr:GNAT family N-acetyltransferase [Myxococcales bacterium]